MEDFVPLDVEEPKQPRVYTRPAAASRPVASSPRKRKREDENVFPWTPSVDWDACPSATAQLSAEINSFYEWVKPSQREHGIRTALIQSIRSAVKSRWPDSEVEPFGSYKTQLYLPSGDIDLVILSEAIARTSPKSTLFAVAALLRARGIAKEVVVVWKARVPIVKFKAAGGSDIAIDISLNQQSGLDAGPIVRQLLNSAGNSTAKCLIMAIKAFLVQRGLHEVFSGGLSSYSVICMVISFLQLHPKIQRKQIDPAQNLGVLLLEFLELYGKHFNFDRTGIAIRSPGGYFDKRRKGWYRDRQPFLLSIEDPQNPAQDISSGTYNILAVRQALGGAFDMLSANMCARALLLKKQPTAKSRNDLTRKSILGTVISLSTDLVASRQLDLSDAVVRLPSPPEWYTGAPATAPTPGPKAKKRKTPQAPKTAERAKEPAGRPLPSATRAAPKPEPEYIILDSDSDSDAVAQPKLSLTEPSRYAISAKKSTLVSKPARKDVQEASSDSDVVEVIRPKQTGAARRDYWLAKGTQMQPGDADAA